MARSRFDLHQKLLDVSGLPCYFQPPEDQRMDYPCIVYEKDSSSIKHADNMKYSRMKRYSLKLIHRDPDYAMPDILLDSFQYISEGTRYIADNLYHDPFTLYF